VLPSGKRNPKPPHDIDIGRRATQHIYQLGVFLLFNNKTKDLDKPNIYVIRIFGFLFIRLP